MPFRVFPLVAGLALAASATVHAQDPGPPGTPPPRSATVLAGLGNSFGWYGANASIYLFDRRWAVHGGLGYAFAGASGHPSGAAWALGIRRYTAGPGSQWFFGALYGLLATVARGGPNPPPGEWRYGPALTGGYQHTADSGFTFLASVGIGFARDPSVTPALDLGIGYSW